jgi:antitoxin StbD
MNMDTIYSHATVSVSELKRNFADILKQADDGPVAVLNHNRPEAYLLPAAHYERLLAYIEDLEDAELVRQRADGPFVEVSLDEL